MAEQAATPTQESASADIHRSASSQSQSRSHSQSGTATAPAAAAVLNNSEKHDPGNARVYNDKDDDSFLDEVENTLLGDSSRLSNSNNSDFDSNAAAAVDTRHFKTFSPSRHPPSTALKSQYLHANHQEALDDPATFRRKCRVALFYLLTSTSHELVIYKLAQRTTWPNAILFIPFEFLLLTAIACLASVYIKKTGNLRMQQSIGVNGPPVSSMFTLKDSTPLAVLTVLAAALTILKDAWLEAAIGTAVSTYIAPALLLILPLIYISTELPKNGFLILTSISIPMLYGLAITDLRVLHSAVFTAVMYVLVEASKMALAKKWFMSETCSPLETMVQYLPHATIFALLTVAPLSAIMGRQDRLPHKWQYYFISYFLTSFLNQIGSLMAVNVFSSPVSVALLTIPRGLLVTLVNGGVTNAHERASHTIFVTFCIATLLIVLATPELRNRFSGQAKQMPLPSSIRDGHQEHEDGSPSSSAVYMSPQAMKYLAMASFTPLLYWFISQFSPPQIDYTKPIQSLKYYTHSPTVDIVISHYDEPAHQVKELIETLRYYPMIKTRDPRFIVYTKSPEENVTRISEGEFLHETGANEVYHLPNLGREAGTYVRHIIRNYNDTINPTLTQYRPAGLADHTLFMQSHLAWDWIAKERLWLFQDNTGYLHFAPYMKLDCGKDMNGNGDFPRLREVYNIFAEELCPPTLQLGAYSSQFVVSKERILANSYHKYKGLQDILESDASHWIHQEGTWWKYHGEPGPSNPYFGHAMERAWPTIFGCTDPSIADTCEGENYNVTGCQCFDGCRR